MCVKLPHRDLNHGSYPPHPTNTYTYKVTTVPKVCISIYKSLLKLRESKRELNGWQFFYFFLFLKQQLL